MPKAYTRKFCDKMVSKLLLPGGPTVIELSKESGISKSALYKWIRKFSNTTSTTGQNMSTQNNIPIRPQNWSAADKLNAVITTSSMTEEEIGAYCRENGIYSKHLAEWRQSMTEGLKPSVNKEQKVENLKLRSEIKSLKSELTRKEKALAETSALLILKKKANLIWGDEKDD